MRRGNGILKAAGVFFAKEPDRLRLHEVDAVINHLRGDFEVEPVCRDLDLSVSSRTRPPPSAFEVRPPAGSATTTSSRRSAASVPIPAPK